MITLEQKKGTRSAAYSQARDILGGLDAPPPRQMLELAYTLKQERAFTYARRILARAASDPRALPDAGLRLEINQQHAFCTYMDTDLPVSDRLDRALGILRGAGEDLSETRSQETLGLAGSIYKRKWEVDNQKSQLERALIYYLRGYREGVEKDQGYTGINAAYVLDLLAQQEEEEAKKAGMESETARRRRYEASAIRRDIIEKVPPLGDRPGGEKLKGDWWLYSTVAEAHFGLGEYDAAVKWLKKGKAAVERIDEWKYETTVRQLAALASRQAGPGKSGEDFQDTPAWKALKEFFGNDAAPVRSAFIGKIGLGLSGGGFRASLFHIGVFARLAELDVLRHVEVLSCVSGGSIVGAHYYLEVRNLLQSKPDAEITREDYIELVKRLEKDFLAGVQRNIRVRVAAELVTNLKMIVVKNYSRTLRAGELYEREIFARVTDGEGDKPRYLDDLNIRPTGEVADFAPKKHNWRRAAKAPILILNAAALNTGHTWQFTTSWMGEPPAGIDSEIDGNDRLRRMYYEEAPAGRRRVRLGHAVSASACVPGLFEPLALDKLYPERTVLMVDGGVCDNQGVGGLLEQDCTVALISDGSGHMESIKEPSGGLLGVPLRSNTILQARIREAQYHELNARRRSGLLRGLMFVHLKSDLDVDPIDWIDCPDPFDSSDDARPAHRKGPLTRYGIAKTVQARLAAVRTDLDSFSDAEAYALMTSGYRMTESAFRDESCVDGFKEPSGRVEWDFLAVEKAMKEPGKPQTELLTLLGVSDRLAFKIWKLSSALKIVSWVLILAALGVAAYFIWLNWGRANNILASLAWGLGVAVVSVAAVALLFLVVGKLFAPVGRLKSLLTKIVIGVVSVIGFAVSRLHLLVFDKMFLRRGSVETLNGRGPS